MECFNIYNWYLRAIEVKCVIKKNGFRHSTLVCMKPCLKVKNENQNRLELLNKRSKLASEADSLNGKEFHIESISFQNSLKLRKYLIIVLYAFLEFICFSRILRKHFSTLTITYGDAYLLESKNVRPILLSISIFALPFNWWKREGKWKKTALNTPCQKKLERRTKQKKIKRKSERNAPVLRMFKYENDDDQALESWRKPIMYSSMSHEWALSSPRSLVRRPVEHEKRNLFTTV